MSPASPRHLAVFDIDGTLTDTSGVDDVCYTAALGKVFGYSSRPEDYDWSAFPHVTDSGIVSELVRRREGRSISAKELDTFERVFVERVSRALARSPESCRPIPGAVALVAALEADPSWTVALATGGFRASALLKLARAGFAPPPVLATSRDGASREDIVRRAMEEARELVDAAFDTTVVVGDAVWDARTAVALELPCLVVGRFATAPWLQELGVAAALRDYVPLEAARSALERAAGQSAITSAQ